MAVGAPSYLCWSCHGDAQLRRPRPPQRPPQAAAPAPGSGHPPAGRGDGGGRAAGGAGRQRQEGREGGRERIQGLPSAITLSDCTHRCQGCRHPSQEHWVPENLISRRRDPWARQLRPSSQGRGSSRGALPTTRVSCCDCSLACRSSPVEQPRGRAPQQLVYQEPETHGKGQPRSFRPLQSLLNSYHLQQVYALK